MKKIKAPFPFRRWGFLLSGPEMQNDKRIQFILGSAAGRRPIGGFNLEEKSFIGYKGTLFKIFKIIIYTPLAI